jgi:hypothetical protein
MTPGARRVLEELAADEECDLIQEGNVVYCGLRQTTSRVVNELLGMMAIEILYRDGFRTPITNFGISHIGHSLLRRPELEQELYIALLKRKPITIINDRIESADALKLRRGEWRNK